MIDNFQPKLLPFFWRCIAPLQGNRFPSGQRQKCCIASDCHSFKTHESQPIINQNGRNNLNFMVPGLILGCSKFGHKFMVKFKVDHKIQIVWKFPHYLNLPKCLYERRILHIFIIVKTIYLNHIDLQLGSIIFISEKLNSKLHSWYNDTELHHWIQVNDLKERRKTFLYSIFDFVFAFNINIKIFWFIFLL